MHNIMHYDQRLATKRSVSSTSMQGSGLARLVRIARGPVSQERFAEHLGVSQESLSRYELGRVKPSTRVLEKCWEAMEARGQSIPPAAEELARQVRRVGGAEYTAVREAIARLIEISVGTGRPGRRARVKA